MLVEKAEKCLADSRHPGVRTEAKGQGTSWEQPGTHRSISLFTYVGEKANVPRIVGEQIRTQHSRGELQSSRLEG